jgi:beta-lactamase regulating signal transducer with metallopeptidase domain
MHTFLYFFSKLVNAESLAAATFKSAILISIAGIIAFHLRRSSAALRHAVWTTAIIGSLSLPFLPFVTPSWKFSLISESTKSEKSVPEIRTNSESIAPNTSKSLPAHSPFVSTKAPPIDNSGSSHVKLPQKFIATPKEIIVFIWLLGCLCLVIWNFVSLAYLCRILLKSKAPLPESSVQSDVEVAKSLGINGKIRLLENLVITVPFTWGFFQPAIFLPVSARNWPLEWRRCVLLHELAHVKRFDCLTQGLATLACIVYWFNPLVWFVAHRLRIERELACDDLVVANGVRASDYAQVLLDIARAVSVKRHAPSLTVGFTHSDLERRIRAIVTSHANRTLPSKGTALMTFATLICINLAIAPLQIVAVGQDITTSTNFALQQVPQNSPQKPAIEFTPKPEPPAEETEAEAAEGENVDQDVEPPDDGNEHLKAVSALEFDKPSMEFLHINPYVPTPHQELLMKIHGVTPEFIASFYELGYPNLPIYQLLSMAQLGITTEYIREIQTLGYDDIWVGDLIYEMSLEKLKEIKEQNPDVSSLHKIHDLLTRPKSDELEVFTLRPLGKPRPKTERELIAAYVAEILRRNRERPKSFLQSLARDNWSLEYAIERSALTETYVKSLQNIGYDRLLAEDFIQLKTYGVTPEYILDLRQKGFNNLTVDQLVQMKIDSVAAK